ncbi:MAG: PDZ domain-containing protein [Rubrivivax sp.]
MGIGFAVPVETARGVMEQLIRGGKVKRGFIGVDIRDLNAELAESLALPVKTGVLVTGVLNEGPAAKGGVRPGDVVLRVGDKAVSPNGWPTTSVCWSARACCWRGRPSAR